MAAFIGGVISVVAAAIAGIFNWKGSKIQQRREAEKDVEKAEKALEDEKDAAHKAIYGKDDEKVNAIIARVLASIVASTALGGALGCAQAEIRVRYVPSDRRIVSMTNEYGVACKAVPDVVFAEMTDKLLEYEAMKKAAKAESRLK